MEPDQCFIYTLFPHTDNPFFLVYQDIFYLRQQQKSLTVNSYCCISLLTWYGLELHISVVTLYFCITILKFTRQSKMWSGRMLRVIEIPVVMEIWQPHDPYLTREVDSVRCGSSLLYEGCLHVGNSCGKLWNWLK